VPGGAQVELPVGRDDEHAELAVDRGEEGLEESGRLDPHCGRDGGSRLRAASTAGVTCKTCRKL
jgi:hypothetical protein